MKKIFFSLLVATIAAGSISGCKKSEDPAPEFPATITNILPQDMIESLRGRGMTIYAGNNPAKADGIFYISPMTLVSPYNGDSWAVGKVVSDYKLYIYGQNESSVNLSYKTIDLSETQSGLGAYISGSGNNFTIFAQVAGISSGIYNKVAVVISGQISSAGITNLQFANVLTYKDADPGGELIPAGTGRIWKDGDYVSMAVNSYRMANTAINEGNKGSILSGK